jgi:glycosyltransferase involved in cell wall biosynthesis
VQSVAGTEELRAIIEDRVEPVVLAIAAEDAGNRRRLYAVRESADYATPFEEADPLVSVTLPTRDRPELLARSLRSLLAQTHEHLEVLVVGDAAGPEVADVIEAIGDPRVHYTNLTQRVAAHPDPNRHWLVGSTMARNEATRGARGAWLLHFDDDDTLRPEAVASLLRVARERRAEVAYGGFARRTPEGPSTDLIAFPPAEDQFGFQGALVHHGLRCFERELVAAHLGIPGDTYLLRRMLRAGVRFALLDKIVWDYFPSRLWPHPTTSRLNGASPPVGGLGLMGDTGLEPVTSALSRRRSPS